MARRTNSEKLLQDVMAEGSASAFHDALLGETLRLTRRRRRVRNATRTALVGAALVALASMVWQYFRPHRSYLSLVNPSYDVVHTAPLPKSAIVITKPFATNCFVDSVAAANVVETTKDSGLFREISDDELLAMFGPKVAALVRLGPHQAELVVLEPAATDSPPN